MMKEGYAIYRTRTTAKGAQIDHTSILRTTPHSTFAPLIGKVGLKVKCNFHRATHFHIYAVMKNDILSKTIVSQFKCLINVLAFKTIKMNRITCLTSFTARCSESNANLNKQKIMGV